MSSFRSTLFLPVVAVVLAVPSLAWADAVPPDTYACDPASAPSHFDSSKIGTPCSFNGAQGTCQKTTCSGIDYEHWDRDASATAPSIKFDCLECTTSDGGTSPTTDGGHATSTGSTSPSSNSGGCSATGTSALRSAGPWLLALVIPLLTFASRRRRTGR
jgi:hypothetical protein